MITFFFVYLVATFGVFFVSPVVALIVAVFGALHIIACMIDVMRLAILSVFSRKG